MYNAIHNRCYNEKVENYKNYGGRGIKMSDEFLGHTGFNNFCDCMGERPSKNHSVDRIDNGKNYERGNLKWSTIHQQHANKRNNNENVGVFFNKKRDKWVASLVVNKKMVFRKGFSNYADAVKARKEQEVIHGIIY